MQYKYLWISEMLWWLGSAFIAAALIFPYYPDLIVDVPFLLPNIILVILMVQCLRLTFFLKQSPWSDSRWLIHLLTFAFIPVGMYTINHYSEMSRFFETSSWMHSFSYLLTLSEKSDIAAYIRIEFTWISVVAFISGFALSGRMIAASWYIVSHRSRR